ncbi:nucleoside deaminase [Oceanirhabdus sp. W0125-5]|uniref:nucleoside deaminase n=1 Tax=Oceanirhabdus sp. W0125-5 TaxID=2999116 RepID=UPI0022F2BC06|nr:nucleoside deaminase [Oceanirhabdus sp. W0125-5]WBW97565.1 nucleoside deaminase [Oceanirhabdus sp. W0125-5]
MNKNEKLDIHKKFMQEAYKEAIIARDKDEVPVGAVIVRNCDKVIIARGHNSKEREKNSLLHAEIIAINKASQFLNEWRLSDCSMYVTLEPCPMCAGAIVQARIKDLYIGTFDERTGACGSVVNITQNENFNHWVNVNWMYDTECSELITNFFRTKRGK